MDAQAGLGDVIAIAFASVGITKDRLQAVANAVGIADCGCAKRQETLNQIGREWLGIGATPGEESPPPAVP